MLSDVDRGLVAGILLSDGSFGGDGKQPHVILRKHVRHEALLRWLVERFPRSRLYGPYHHGERSYFQWVARGPVLVEDVLPVLDAVVVPELDAHAAARLREMRERYAPYIARVRARSQLTVERRLTELARRYALPAPAVTSLGALLGLLAEDPFAPTTITEPERAVDVHVADALVALELAEVRAARRIADLGSGAGFPGLALAAALPQARIALVEANARKCSFLERAVRAMALDNVDVVGARAEQWTAGARSRDLVTARALAPLNVLVEYAAPLLEVGGVLVAWKGERDHAAERDGAAAAAATGLRPGGVVGVQPWDGAERLHLHLYLKVGLTPNRFPRRAGMASKRPLRAST